MRLQLRRIIEGLDGFEFQDYLIIYDYVCSQVTNDVSLKWNGDYALRFIGDTFTS